jgi:hypothetical protein
MRIIRFKRESVGWEEYIAWCGDNDFTRLHHDQSKIEIQRRELFYICAILYTYSVYITSEQESEGLYLPPLQIFIIQLGKK